MQTEALVERTLHLEGLYVRVAWLCGVVMFLEGYNIAYWSATHVPSLVDDWRVPSPGFDSSPSRQSNVGLLLGSLCFGLLGDRLGSGNLFCFPALAGFGIFSLLSALVSSPFQLAALRNFLTGLGLGGGIPLAIALVSDFSPPLKQGRTVILTSAGIPIGPLRPEDSWRASLFEVSGWPAIFMVGGILPLAIAPLLALYLPESLCPDAARPRRKSRVAALFRGRGLRLAPRCYGQLTF